MPEMLESVVLEGKLGLEGFVTEVEVVIGVSEARSRYVSAAMMPPIEWPTRMV